MSTRKQFHLRIEGMHCAACVSRVQQALADTPGVVTAHVDLMSRTALVQSDDSTTLDGLTQAVRDCGYSASKLEPTSLDAPRSAVDPAGEQSELRLHRQALVTALMYGLPILALDVFGPGLQSPGPGGHIWWRALQAILSALALYSPAGGPILAGALRALLHRVADMNLLLSLGLLAAFLASTAAIFIPGAHHFDFHAVAMILIFIDVGRFLEAKARRSVSDTISALMRHVPLNALLVVNGEVREVPLGQVKIGDRLRVVPDSQVPVDGTIIEGDASVDQSMLTGESIPVERHPGDSVYGGTMLVDGALTIQATRIGADSAVGRIIDAVRQAQASPTRMQRVADQVAGVFVPIVVAIALLTLLGWLVLGPQDNSWHVALSSAVAVLVIACPCALGLATPTAVYIATARAALKNILVRSAPALEQLGRTHDLVFDKTGTLTTAQVQVGRLISLLPGDPAQTETELLRLAASLEQFSQHPIARAIVAAARDRGLTLSTPSDFANEPGLGASGIVDGSYIRIGNREFLRRHLIPTQHHDAVAGELASGSQGVIWVARGDEVAGLCGISDQTRPSAEPALRDIRSLGLRISMVTGDDPQVAARVATALGIEVVHAQILPAQKAEIIAELQRQHRVVAFVGDGINDAPAITQADVGISFAAGTDVAKQAADLVLVGTDLGRVADAIRLARRTLRIIYQNLFWAFSYNLAAIPLAALAIIPHWLAPAAMMFSSLSVVLNSLRLKRL